MADPLSQFIDGLTGRAVNSATAAASAQAQAQWEQYKPWVYLVTAVASFMAITAWVFYFLPRFVSPFRRAS